MHKKLIDAILSVDADVQDLAREIDSACWPINGLINGYTLLHYAARADWSADEDLRMKYLVEKGAPLNARAISRNSLHDGRDWTPLMVACYWGHLAQLKYLLTVGADPSLRDEAGLTVFDIARYAWDAERKLEYLGSWQRQADGVAPTIIKPSPETPPVR